MSLPTREDLAKLPSRAIVAYGVRCARRVEPRYAAAMSHRQDLVAAVDFAIQQAERYASGEALLVENTLSEAAAAAAYAAQAAVADAADAAARAAHAAARAAHAAVDADTTVDTPVTARAAHAASFAASFAAFAAADVADAAAFVSAAKHDFQQLTDLTRSGEDRAISPSDDGPLGPLWPNGPPSSHANVECRRTRF